MFKRNAMGNTRAKLLAGAVLMTLGLSATGAAMSTDVFGGGATLPAGGYLGWAFTPSQIFSANVASPSQTAAAIDSASLLGHWSFVSGNKLAYCQTGSGNGKKIFDHSSGTAQLVGGTGACDGTVNTGKGFGANASVVDPHFAGSDAPMSQDEFNWFGNGSPANPLFGQKTAANGQPVQFPSIVGSVAIAYNNPDVPSLDFSDAGLCKVLTGSVANWNQFTSTDFNTAPSVGLPLPSRVLHLAYRSDGSGTTFSLANHISSVCSGFKTDQAFTTVVGGFGTLPPALPTSVANFSLPASGNTGVVTAINSNPGAIGYAEAANLKNTTGVTSITVAKVLGKDPYADLAGTVTFSSLLSDNVIVGTNANGTPHVQAMSPAAPTPGCVLMVNPASYAAGAGYPIVAVSSLIFNQKGNGADAAALQDLLTHGIYGTVTERTGITLVGAGTGYAFINAPVAKAKVNTCVVS
jgi:phosphate transport system substrate-binding protein